MALAGKLLQTLGLAANFGRGFHSHWRIRQLFTGLLAVAGMAIITAMMIGTLIIGIFYAIYLSFMHNGISAEQALLYVGIIVLLTTIVCAAITRACMTHLRNIPHSDPLHPSVVSRMHDTLDAFIDGFMAR